jgi:CheY-like chemotaxis protein
MLYHRALGRDLHKLVIAVVDNRRPMLLVMRAMLAAIGAGRIHTYESPTGAIGTMATATPDLVIAADVMQPLNGPALVRTMRRPSSGALALVPVIIMTAHAKPALVAEALRSGVHQVLALPTSAITLARRLDRLLNDDRPFELKGDHYVVSGIEERLAVNFQRSAQSPAEVTFPPPRSACEDEEPLLLDLVETARVARN